MTSRQKTVEVPQGDWLSKQFLIVEHGARRIEGLGEKPTLPLEQPNYGAGFGIERAVALTAYREFRIEIAVTPQAEDEPDVRRVGVCGRHAG